MIPVVWTCYVGPDQLLLDKSNLAAHKTAGLPALIGVTKAPCQIHEYTYISNRRKRKDICKLKLGTKILINLHERLLQLQISKQKNYDIVSTKHLVS